MSSIESMKFQRNKLVTDAQEILKKSEVEERNLTAEEREKFDRYMTDVDDIKSDLQRAESLAATEAELRTVEPRKTEPTALARTDEDTPYNGTREYRSAFYSYVRKGNNGLRPEEFRALEEGENAEGGFTVETSLERRITEQLNTLNPFRTISTVLPIEGNRAIPVESAVGVATWTAEEVAMTEADMTFSQTVLNGYKLAAILKVSDELMTGNVLGDAGFESYLAGYFGRIFATAEDAAFATGSGTNQPSGIFNTSVGIPAVAAQVQDVTTTDAIEADDLVNLYHKLAPQYRFGATWVMNDVNAKRIRSIKNEEGGAGTGNYMWQPGMSEGDPDRLFGNPVKVSSGAPTDITSADVPLIIFGDFSYYYIAERGGFNFQRMNELYAATGQVGLRAWRFLDGNFTLSSAFAVLSNGS